MGIADESTSTDFPKSYPWAGYLLGFAIGGFFDGILLHQVLQWHHLLSGLESGRFGDLRFQILADGLFHALMYLVALVGLFLLWRSREAFARPKADRLIAANALIGFGAWHVIDGIVSHWVLGIHRIRMDAENPLFWDVLWLVVFGVGFLAAGWFLRSGGSPGPGRRGGAAAALLAICTVLAGTMTMVPAPKAPALLVVFRPGIEPAQALSAVASVGGSLVWSDEADAVWAVAVPEGAPILDLYRNGALLVSGSPVLAGCFNWIRT